MKLFDVYPLYPIELVKAQGSTVWDKNGQEYLDLYGGHAVISIGHSHPTYVAKMSEQLSNIGFYSNSIVIGGQAELAEKLGRISGYPTYQLFLTNSGAESNENALKLASFHTGRKKVVSFTKAFHGRTAGAVAVTDNPSIVAPINDTSHVTFHPFNQIEGLSDVITEETAAVIVEGIQGVGGIQVASTPFLQALRQRCDETGAQLILDSVQCGYGRSGKFFSHQYAGINPDMMTTAKGMGNGFPVGGVLIAPHIQASYGLLGTTFGGNHLACTAANVVLDIMEEDNLLDNATKIGAYIEQELAGMAGIKEVRGRGLMIGIELEEAVGPIRDALLHQHHIFMGYAGKHTLRLLPSLAIDQPIADRFLESLRAVLKG
ncbi:aspartate aminotransferase family protein [Aquirufa regiilacus]|uniref:Aminotransferase class III-fold pyridoxal phosphate-dependent enzyme n=1 Tax=Aquirufa regiilacus TaxID=3024868 RepID=A0ABU3TUW6_9BACT|nr:MULTISPECIES: aminotransferase class III-fold pyridoxal phosphate-dependent enzyme [unclassified Aquirufa]MDT8887922.1 aminotransferase class III-fold pyridoxal phosphate-dependent enzyme [Aquirufa sp. LEPPI-3A]MDU0809657.1 aminotransferase class III-fold pyridoxal phosphate-dependent enzyme [Aquirufa sp. LEOWEIH-7C]